MFFWLVWVAMKNSITGFLLYSWFLTQHLCHTLLQKCHHLWVVLSVLWLFHVNIWILVYLTSCFVFVEPVPSLISCLCVCLCVCVSLWFPHLLWFSYLFPPPPYISSKVFFVQCESLFIDLVVPLLVSSPPDSPSLVSHVSLSICFCSWIFLPWQWISCFYIKVLVRTPAWLPPVSPAFGSSNSSSQHVQLTENSFHYEKCPLMQLQIVCHKKYCIDTTCKARFRGERNQISRTCSLYLDRVLSFVFFVFFSMAQKTGNFANYSNDQL